KCSASTRRPGRSGIGRGSRYGSAPTTFPRRAPRRQCPTASTTRPPTPGGGGCRWAAMGTPPVFAVATLRRWGNGEGRHRYPAASRLLITADAGGANGYRVRAWKQELAGFAHASGLQVTVCHFPPGTSKWNKIEHRLFSRISSNWRGRPLTSHDGTIGATTTRT